MLHEKNTWALEKEEMVASPTGDGKSPKGEEKAEAPTRKRSIQKRPSILSNDGQVGVFEESSPVAVESVIVAEMAELKSRILEKQELVKEVQVENSRLIGVVEHERKTTVLLQAELDALPDYIFLYHQERKVILNCT
jgi:hypothetical protein